MKKIKKEKGSKPLTTDNKKLVSYIKRDSYQ